MTPVLIHGDMLPGNLLYTAHGANVAGFRGREPCRLVGARDRGGRSYYLPFDKLLSFFLDHYDTGASSYEGIPDGHPAPEHVRQDLRYVCISTFNGTDRQAAQAKVRRYEEKIKVSPGRH